MTIDKIALRELLEKGSDADLLREIKRRNSVSRRIDPLGGDDPELAQQTTDRVGELGALPNQQRPGSMQRQDGLLCSPGAPVDEPRDKSGYHVLNVL